MRLLLAFWLLSISTPVIGQCSPTATVQAAQIVRQRQAELLKVKVGELETEIPPALQKTIHSFKDAVVTAVDAGVSCGAAAEEAGAMQGRLAKLLSANQPAKSFTPSADSSDVPSEGLYASDLKISVSTPSNAPNLRAVEFSYGIECGADTLLLIYETTPQGWSRKLLWQSPDYKDISRAFGDFFLFAILPDNGQSGLRVVVAHGMPWCTSRLSGFKMDLLATELEAQAPLVLWHRDAGYSRGDTVPRLRSAADGFELRLNNVAIDFNGYERTVIYRYRVDGDKVSRIEPIAVNGRGFVEEWMDMPWSEAEAQTAPKAVPTMKVIHERRAQNDKDPKTYVSYTYGPVRACLTKGRYEVEMDASPGGPQFYAIEQNQDGYTMVNFATTQDDRCNGPDLMKKR